MKQLRQWKNRRLTNQWYVWFIAAAVTAAVIGMGGWIGLWLVHGAHEQQVNWRVSNHEALIRKHARQANLPPAMVLAVVRAESGGDPAAVSNKHARGLMQITPITLEEVRQRFHVGAGDLFDPDYNLLVGTTYLGYLMRRFDRDERLSLAAYHMGPTRVARLLKRYPKLDGAALVARHANPTTRAYVRTVMADQ